MPIDQNFKSIQKQWYQKLKDEGFKDIENEKEQLRQPNQYSIQNAVLNKDYREAHFDKCSNFLNSCFVIDDMDANIWERYTYGESIRKIARSLNVTKMTVEWRLNKLKKICDFFNWLCDDNLKESDDHGYDINS